MAGAANERPKDEVDGGAIGLHKHAVAIRRGDRRSRLIGERTDPHDQVGGERDKVEGEPHKVADAWGVVGVRVGLNPVT